jgi:NTE family protein
MSINHSVVFGLVLLLLGGCTTYGVVDNPPMQKIDLDAGYSWRALAEHRSDQDLVVMLSLSGGGTRAAALAYGVLQGLRDTMIEVDGKQVSLLKEVDYISSVSGGSFTAAYYGLYGDRLFEDFEQDFLLLDVEGHLLWGLLNPLEWIRPGGRTEMAIRYYNEKIFHDATFADMNTEDGTLILINASDLAHGVRFSFIQDYFNLLCSDLDSFSVARAVTASSAVPILFLPVVLENYRDCDTSHLPWLERIRKHAGTDPLMNQMVKDIDSLLDKQERRYVHLVDGGITDNLGLRARYELITLAGGAQASERSLHHKPPSHLIIISVDASTDPKSSMDQSTAEPSIIKTIGAMTDVQLHRYNTGTLELVENSMKQWSKALSTPEHPVTPYFIRIGEQQITSSQHRLFFNQIPTSFGLSKEQVDRLVVGGRRMLLDDPEYRKLVTDLGAHIQQKPNQGPADDVQPQPQQETNRSPRTLTNPARQAGPG